MAEQHGYSDEFLAGFDNFLRDNIRAIKNPYLEGSQKWKDYRMGHHLYKSFVYNFWDFPSLRGYIKLFRENLFSLEQVEQDIRAMWPEMVRQIQQRGSNMRNINRGV